MRDQELQSFIARMKLRELQRYRTRLHGLYDGMEQRAAETSSPVEALRALYEGLCGLEVAGRRVHPEVANLDVVLAAGASSGEAALVESWIGRLRAKIRQGRSRADAITLFGGLLGEWLSADRRMADPGGVVDDAVAMASVEGAAVDLEVVTGAMEAALGEGELARLRALLGAQSAERIDTTWAAAEVEGLVGRLATRRHLPVGLAEVLRALAEIDPETFMPPAMTRELQSAMRIAWEDIAAWDWGAEVALRPEWARNRWRVLAAPGLIDLLVAELLGGLVYGFVGSVEGVARRNRMARLVRLEELNAPEIITINERRMLDESFDLGGVSRPFEWRGAAPLAPDATPGEVLGEAGSIRRLRMDRLAELSSASLDTGYAGGDGAYSGDRAITRAFGIVYAEIEASQALRPGQPVYVIKTDLSDFYPTMPHALVLGLLRWLGIDERMVALVGRLVGQPLPGGGRARRGLPLGLTISRALGVLVMTALRAFVLDAADVLVLGLVDDLIIMARSREEAEVAWDAVEAFVEAAGLKLNARKTGACCIPGGAPGGRLPQGPVRWGMLELGADGRWSLCEEALEGFIGLTRAQIEAHSALLDRVSVYRQQLHYLLTWLAPGARLDEGHPARVQAALRRFEGLRLESEGASYTGVSAMLRGELARRFVGGASLDLPDAWLHWPLTAGGLALPYAATELVPLARARAAYEAPPRPEVAGEDAERADEAWGRWYMGLMELHRPAQPEETEDAKPLIAAFIARGGQVRGGVQHDLAPSWRWILSTFGPDILECFGRFDFIDTDLVPLDVIRAGFGG